MQFSEKVSSYRYQSMLDHLMEEWEEFKLLEEAQLQLDY